MEVQVVNVLSSGSRGNCEIYHGSIMCDVGVSFSVIKPYLKDIQIVLATHGHSDHLNIKTLKRLQFERPSLRIAAGDWMREYLTELNNVDILELNKWYDYGEFKVSIGKLYHDIQNGFWRIEKNGHKTFRATDTNTLQGISAFHYDLFCIESNYCDEYVNEIILKKQKTGEFSYEKGAVNSHLSEQSAMDFYYANKGEHSQLIRLHMSQSYI